MKKRHIYTQAQYGSWTNKRKKYIRIHFDTAIKYHHRLYRAKAKWLATLTVHIRQLSMGFGSSRSFALLATFQTENIPWPPTRFNVNFSQLVDCVQLVLLYLLIFLLVSLWLAAQRMQPKTSSKNVSHSNMQQCHRSFLFWFVLNS